MSYILENLSHHAYCIVGNDSTKESLKSELESKHKIKISGNPDFLERSFTTFSIDDARELKRLASIKSSDEKAKKIFVLYMENILVEAQNSMLKLLEEPVENTLFFIIIPSSHILIPTIKSRLEIINTEAGNVPNSESIDMAKKFLKSSMSKRMEMVGEILKDIDNEEKTKQYIFDFLYALESVIHKDLKTAKDLKDNKILLERILRAKKYINDRSPSLKMLLESIALAS